ncbi:MAG: hypothetical protein J7639_19405 [Paenibacillaceae bacterium]|nr:hypothetical protein [Paenibacillaceae bacterium]
MKLQQRTIELLTAEQTPDERQELASRLLNGGYSQFSSLLTDLKQEIMSCEENRLEHVRTLLHQARELVPEPVLISPSWERIWDEYDAVLRVKEEVLQEIAPERRDGEWQIIMDNPFTNEGISCYPSLSFIEAAYLYAYFRKDLKKTEYIRLQKIDTLIMTQGS